ncbi:MAG: ATP-binding cassette domain-containing protein [Eubacteriales bacterium]|nr:ATP-binding cassette domain-containing protein [Eubacteriales bacterium]
MEERTIRIQESCRVGTPTLLGFSPYGHTEDHVINGRIPLGRKTGAENEEGICVLSPAVSRKHGEFGLVEDRVFYRDMGSSNGTYMNGQRCEEICQLKEGDILSFRFRHSSEEIVYLFIFTFAQASYQWEKIDLSREMDEIMVSRGRKNLKLTDQTISRNHAVFLKSDEGWSVTDLNSTNGVAVNGEKIDGRRWLKNFDVVRIGNTWFVYLGEQLWIGRETARIDNSCMDTTVPDAGGPEAEAAVGPGNAVYGDCDSEPVYTASCDRVPKSAYAESCDRYSEPVYESDRNKESEPEYPEKDSSETDHAESGRSVDNTVRDEVVEAWDGEYLSIHIRERNVWKRFKKKTLLRDIDLQIAPGEFVLILGGSGAGKSTFMKAVIGYEKAEGSISFGDTDIYEEYDKMRYEIGYVPQKDLIRNSDSVFHTVLSAAKMKMEGDLSEAEYREQADWVIQLLGLSPDRDTLAGRLSGGQRKRLSIAVELVGDPNLFFLDEPDSGLDGVMARELMLNLRRIADMGKIVMVISHGPDRAADLFTKVLVLAKSQEDQTGHLAFFGGVEEAKQYFEVNCLEDIVRRINRIDEGGEGLADVFIKRAESRRTGG